MILQRRNRVSRLADGVGNNTSSFKFERYAMISLSKVARTGKCQVNSDLDAEFDLPLVSLLPRVEIELISLLG